MYLRPTLRRECIFAYTVLLQTTQWTPARNWQSSRHSGLNLPADQKL